MKLFKRSDFIKLPKNTIYSRTDKSSMYLLEGLFCKVSSLDEYKNDFCEQDLLSEAGFPNEIKDGTDAIEYQLNLRDTYQDFRTDLDCCGRDALFDDEDEFVVWDKTDINKLMKFLSNCLNSY